MVENKDFKDLEAAVNKLVKELFDTDAFRELNPEGKIVYDFSIKLKEGKKSVAKTVSKVDPMVDIIDEGSSYRVLFEIPGLEEDKLDLKVSPLNLNLKVKGLAGTYAKTIEFKGFIVVESVKANYNNGILEVLVAKQKKFLKK